MRGKILLFATFLALLAMLSVSCRTLPVGTAEVAVEVVVEVEAEHTDAVPAPQPAPAPDQEPVPVPSEQISGDQVPGSEPAAPSDSPSDPAPEPAPAPQPSPVPEPNPARVWVTGERGPNGGLIFNCGSKALELGNPRCHGYAYNDAVAYCEQLSLAHNATYRLPTIAELSAIYNTLVITGIADVELTYYWSCEQSEEGTTMVMNFDTGFAGSFYSDLGFLSVIPVTELP
ncbi:MAG: hypothetical protein J5775_06250 [Spirochaetales bacterium]|nr:hypothetical protein [Spirochaetales bacterium]